MILDYFKEKINPYFSSAFSFLKNNLEEILMITVVLFSSLVGYGAGRAYDIFDKRPPIVIEGPDKDSIFNKMSASVSNPASPGSSDNSLEYFVASKNGAKYYFPWCSGASKISPNNLIKFNTREEAELAGYEKASNCRGL